MKDTPITRRTLIAGAAAAAGGALIANIGAQLIVYRFDPLRERK